MDGWISLHRKLFNWEWYHDLNTKSIFIHCLLMANHKEKKWKGVTIKRGSFITSFSHLSSETGISFQSVRTAIRNLEATGEIKKESTSKNTLITIINYDGYQKSQQSHNKQITELQHASNKQLTTTNNDDNYNNEIINSTTSKNKKNCDLKIQNINLNNVEEKEKKLREKKKNIQEQINELKTNKIWLESVCIQSKMSKTKLKNRLDEFLHFLIASGKDTKDERDLKSHFINWVSSRDRIPKKNIKKTYQPFNKNTQGIPIQSFTKNR